MRSFHGLASFYRRFVRDFGTLSAPLNEIVKKSYGFKREENQESVFQALKDRLTHASILALLNFANHLKWNLISYFSEKLKSTHPNYSTYDKELYALMRDYMFGNIICCPRSMLSKSHAKWMEFIKQFHYVIKHKQGKMNIVVDALSMRYASIAMLETKLLGLECLKELYK
ncbi:Retrovirus-related Pol polyprotein from transposon gypsy, partial [Mucuna pruriens]